MKKDNIQVWADAIAATIPELSQGLAQQLTAGSDEFYKYAKHIVEPNIEDSDAMLAYCTFTETDIDNWVGWIRSTFGEGWGEVAVLVATEGY